MAVQSASATSLWAASVWRFDQRGEARVFFAVGDNGSDEDGHRRPKTVVPEMAPTRTGNVRFSEFASWGGNCTFCLCLEQRKGWTFCTSGRLLIC
jgi:hypothetical protein